MIDKSRFTSKKELFKYLIANKKDLIDVKKSIIKHCNPINSIEVDGITSKALETNHKDDLSSGVIKRTIIGNTYNWLDSHDDVHVKGIFSKSIKERKNKVRHYHDHINQLSAQVGKFTDVYEKDVKWSDLGVNKVGTTTVLMADSDILERMNKNIFLQYANKEIDQHSVGMYYVKIEMAVNDAEYKEEKAVYDAYVDLIANKEKAEEQGYFFVVKEAKLIEISAVPEGSNEITPTIDNKVNPSKDNLDKSDPSEDSHKVNNNKLKKLC